MLLLTVRAVSAWGAGTLLLAAVISPAPALAAGTEERPPRGDTTAAAGTAVVGTAAAGTAVAGTANPAAVNPSRPGDAALAAAVRRAVAGAGFTDVVDFGPEEGACPGGGGCPTRAPRIAHVPNVDTAVVELDGAGRVVAATDVLLSRDYPDPVAVPVDDRLRVTGVTWYRWDSARADGATAWNGTRVSSDEVVPASPGARYSFMSPYPASVFQLMVAAGTLHLVDQGLLRLDGRYHYLQAPGSTCLGSTFTDTRSTRELLDRMVTSADTRSTCMLLKQLSDFGQFDAVTAWLSGLGLGTLQLSGIDRGSGGRWDPRQITMTAMDTARLLLLVNGTPGAVTGGAPLSPASRTLLRGLLADQGFNEVLSTSNWCGRAYPAAGIPQRVPSRWIDGPSGTVTVDGIPYGQNVRPCNATAQVTFAHQTGLTYNFGADAGIVDSLPGSRDRHYVIVVLSDLGYRYADLRNAGSSTLPCTVDVCYTEAFARLGRAVDEAIGRGHGPTPPRAAPSASAPVRAPAGPGPVPSAPASSGLASPGSTPSGPASGPGAGPQPRQVMPRPAGSAIAVSWAGR